MTTKHALITATIAATLIGSGTALAQEHKTREQVRTELAEAIRSNSILSGDSTMWKDLAPPVHRSGLRVGKTRGQVQAELACAIRTDAISSGDSSFYNDVARGRFPAAELTVRATCLPELPIMAEGGEFV